MDSVQGLSLKVDRYLKETRDLINQHHAGGEGDANNSTAGITDNGIRSDIYRRFTLLHSIFTSDNDSSTPELTRVKNLILDAEREMRATKEDIKGARIVIPSRKPIHQFHSYLQLPGPVVRVRILSYLTEPQDQLNIMDAVPSEEQLMNWNREKIKLELVFRIMMERGSYFDNENPLGIAYTFSRASQVHQSIVERFIEATWLKKGFYQWLHGMHSVRVMGALEIFEDVNSHYWLPKFVNFQFSFDGNGDDDDTENYNWNMSVLQRIGHRIWFFKLSIVAASSALQILELLKNCLSLLPNVKVVDLKVVQLYLMPGFNYPRSTEEIERDLKSIENFHLPECPSLRILTLSGFSIFSLVISPILAKYSVGLLRLHISVNAHIEFSNIVEFQSPKLSVLEVSCDQTDGVYDVPQYLRMFPNAPLKYLKLSKSNLYGRIGQVNFSNILSFVSRHYGGTLEQLELENLPCHSSLSSYILDSTWMLKTSFPNVKSLHLFNRIPNYTLYGVRQQIGGFAFVMLFPALEELHFFNETHNGTEESFFGTDPNYLELSLIRQDMLKSVIWKLFPKLSSIEFAGRGNGFSVKSRVTRKECIQVQQNME